MFLLVGLIALAPAALASAAPPDPALAGLSKLNGHAFDVAFLRMLIPADDEAIEVAMTATLYADHPDLLHWNQTFVERDRAQVRQMLAWLAEMGAQPADRKEGVATPSVKKMRTLRGAALERAYLSLMSARFDQDVAVARLAAHKASQPALRSFAEQIVRVEGQDSGMLRGWLKKWYQSAGAFPGRSREGRVSD